MTHAGGLVQLSLSYLLNKNIKLFLDGGYCLWFSLDSVLYSDMMGPFVGGGVTVKY